MTLSIMEASNGLVYMLESKLKRDSIHKKNIKEYKDFTIG